jgi:hypothetical protein
MARTRKHTRSRHIRTYPLAEAPWCDQLQRRLVVHTSHHGAGLADDNDARVRFALERMGAVSRTPGMVKKGVLVRGQILGS